MKRKEPPITFTRQVSPSLSLKQHVKREVVFIPKETNGYDIWSACHRTSGIRQDNLLPEDEGDPRAVGQTRRHNKH